LRVIFFAKISSLRSITAGVKNKSQVLHVCPQRQNTSFFLKKKPKIRQTLGAITSAWTLFAELKNTGLGSLRRGAWIVPSRCPKSYKSNLKKKKTCVPTGGFGVSISKS
jgi:hypothetical protein